MTDIVDKSGAGGVEEHVSALSACQPSISEYPITVSGKGLLVRLGKLLFPYSLYQYEGRQKSMSKLLGLSVSSYETLAKPSGDMNLSPAVCNRAGKICSDMIAALQVEQTYWREQELIALKARAPRHRGMFQVRVRDDSGIPRTGLARDGWRRKNTEPF